MNLSEAVAEVLSAVHRPDKQVEAISAINRAIKYCTLLGDFRADRVEATINIDPTLYGDTVSIASLARFRRFTYVKPTGVRYYLTPIDEDKIFTPKNQMQPNVYYIAGTNLTYTLSALASSLEVGYLTYPVTLDLVTNNTHWMLDAIPEAIIELAISKLFQDIGDDASATRFQKSGFELFIAYRRDNHQGG